MGEADHGPLNSETGFLALTAPDPESEFRVNEVLADGRRRCGDCGTVFVLQKPKRAICPSCVHKKRAPRNSSGVGGRRVVLFDTIKDVWLAITELTRAHDELRAIAASGETGHRRQAMEQEPLSRINLARGLTGDALKRHGREEILRDQAKDQASDSP